MRRGFLLHGGDNLYSPYPRTRNKKIEHNDYRLFNDADVRAPLHFPDASYTVKELKDWGKTSVRLADDPVMSSRVNLRDLGLNQRLVFHNIRVGTTEVSTLLDSAVLNLIPTRLSPPATPLGAFEFRQTHNKGMGAFATQNIRAAALLHVEIPATIIQNTLVLNFGLTRADVYRKLIERVPKTTLTALLSLHNSQPPDTCDLEEAILRSNSLGIDIPAPAVPASVAMGHSALFLQASRLNHSCSPNVVHHFDPQSFTLTVHTTRAIAKGEEIVYSYIDLASTPTRDARRSLLRERYNFECVCDRCVLPDEAVHESDMRRERIRETTRDVTSPFQAWYRNDGQDDLQKVIEFHLAAVEDMQIEGLAHHPYFLHVSLLATCFAALEDIRGFRSWMGKARDVALGNLASDLALDMLRYIVYPETFPGWGSARRIRNRPWAV
ncbi:SET domain-containing protein [Mycena sanguinolenta]|uniref:SET domain-containing protein n=1 Tax=Mycena sanguinolenta TaxID=230812 RepID=A0A8H6ZHG9_9AGAR|nr:SET domain-containing protein [Mycena sanguinolenta]